LGQQSADQVVLDLNHGAMDAYNNMDINKAGSMLEEALRVAIEGRVAGALLAQTNMNLAIVYIGVSVTTIAACATSRMHSALIRARNSIRSRARRTFKACFKWPRSACNRPAVPAHKANRISRPVSQRRRCRWLLDNRLGHRRRTWMASCLRVGAPR